MGGRSRDEGGRAEVRRGLSMISSGNGRVDEGLKAMSSGESNEGNSVGFEGFQ